MSPTPAPTVDHAGDPTPWTRAMLVALLAGASFAFSLAFACATPLAGLAAVAVLGLKRRDALAAVSLAWTINQANGFVFLHYPWTWSCIGWGFAIWVAAIAATCSASASMQVPARPGLPIRIVAAGAALACAFLAYEAVLLAATLVLPSEPSAFSPAVMSRLFTINAACFALLLAVIGALKTLHPGLPLAPIVPARAR